MRLSALPGHCKAGKRLVQRTFSQRPIVIGGFLSPSADAELHDTANPWGGGLGKASLPAHHLIRLLCLFIRYWLLRKSPYFTRSRVNSLKRALVPHPVG